jgi:DNA-binding transcriptional regulator LsrR (DeoR family)
MSAGGASLPVMAGPAQLVLTASVARLYYVEGRSKIEIAQELDVSRFKVARLLAKARTSGLVSVVIGGPGVIDVNLSSRLQQAYGLRHAVVVDVQDEHPAVLRQHLGEAAADLLSEVLTSGDVLGLAWARSVSAMAHALSRLPALPVVQLTGSPARPGGDSFTEVVRGVARLSGGRAYHFDAPLVVGDAATARVLRRQPEIVRAFDQFAAVTKAIVGIGLLSPGESTLFDALDDSQQRRLRELGALADVSGIPVGVDGNAVLAELNDRRIGMSAAQLRSVPEVLAITYGAARAPAVRAALRGGLVNGLVTDAALADVLLTRG